MKYLKYMGGAATSWLLYKKQVDSNRLWELFAEMVKICYNNDHIIL